MKQTSNKNMPNNFPTFVDVSTFSTRDKSLESKTLYDVW